MTDNGKNVLDEALELIGGQRREDYGEPKTAFCEIARMWSAWLGIGVLPEDVCMMMILLKMARFKLSGFSHSDSLVDMAGYAGCCEKLGADDENSFNHFAKEAGA